MTKTFLKVNILSILIVGLSAIIFWTSQNNSSLICLKLNGSEKNECVMRLLDRYLVKREVGKALSFLNNYQLQDKNFYATDCHGLVHYIGDNAYRFQKEGYKIDFGRFSSICEYGFYHAFTSSFILSGEFVEARKYCDEMTNKNSSGSVGCYHGMGHGAVYDFHEDYGITDPEMIITKGVGLCEQILSGDVGLNECVTGVYDGIGDVVLKESYKDLTPRKIYAYCINQPAKYKDICYENISHLVFRKTKLSFSYLVDFVMANPGIKNKKSAIEGLALIYIVDLKSESVDSGLLVCKKLPNDIKNACILNMGYKLAVDALSGKHFEAGKKFCTNSNLSEKESLECFSKVVGRLNSFYSKKQLESKCNSENIEIYKEACLKSINEN